MRRIRNIIKGTMRPTVRPIINPLLFDVDPFVALD
jgi:hypothetical protein